jgi:GR25 family glycosyltransferase involved in LPS biosynthesis
VSIRRLHVINLARRPDRLDRFRRLHPEIALVRVEAVDGMQQDSQELVRRNLLAPGHCYMPGAIGCALTHFALWQLCAKSGAPLHIAEDDVVFCEKFCEIAATVLADLGDWDFVHWGCNGDWPMRIKSEYGENAALVIPDLEENVVTDTRPRVQSPHAFRLLFGMGTGGYSISPTGASQLIAKCLPFGANPAPICRPKPDGLALAPSAKRSQETFLKPFMGLNNANNGIDAELCCHYAGLKAFVCLPALARHGFDASDSSIQTA